MGIEGVRPDVDGDAFLGLDSALAAMLVRPLGKTGLSVSALGLGAGGIGDPELSEDVVRELLNTALDLGITLIDTARSYGSSEERIGRHLSQRRSEFVLSTKGGYLVEGESDWTGTAVGAGIDRALRVMQTDHIDVFHLHSCPRETAMRDDIGRALEQAKAAGKIRVIAYSGEGDAVAAAVRAGIFGVVQCSVNLFDQANLDDTLLRASHGGVGVIAKRSVANAVWRHVAWPDDDDAEYWERMQAMQLDPGTDGWLDLALRFSAFAPGVSAALVGTANVAHLVQCAEIVEKGDLSGTHRRRIEASFAVKSRGWAGKI
jgi:aryl-alcohol dehydrogenase-like predicted oxidoreductase